MGQVAKWLRKCFTGRRPRPCTHRLVTTRRPPASTTRRRRIPTTRPTTGPRTTIGAAPTTNGTTSTRATGKCCDETAPDAHQDHKAKRVPFDEHAHTAKKNIFGHEMQEHARPSYAASC